MGIRRSLDCRCNFSDQLRQITQNCAVTRTFHRATMGMSQHDDGFGTRYFSRIFQAAQDVFIDDIASYTCSEHVADTLIKYQCRIRTGIDAGNHAHEGILTVFTADFCLSHQVALQHTARHKSCISILQTLDREIRRNFTLRDFSHRHG